MILNQMQKLLKAKQRTNTIELKMRVWFRRKDISVQEVANYTHSIAVLLRSLCCCLQISESQSFGTRSILVVFLFLFNTKFSWELDIIMTQKRKFVLTYAMKACRENGSRAPLILNLDCMWKPHTLAILFPGTQSPLSANTVIIHLFLNNVFSSIPVQNYCKAGRCAKISYKLRFKRFKYKKWFPSFIQ